MRRASILILVASLALATAACGQDPPRAGGARHELAAEESKAPSKAIKEFDAGMKALQANQLPAAEQHLAAATTAFPAYTRAYNALGVVQMKLGEKDQGVASFQKALALHPDYSEALVNLARVRIQEKNTAVAEKLLARAIESDPNSADALVLLANLQFEQGRYDEAAATAIKVHQVKSGDEGYAVAHYIAAKSFALRQDDSQALAEYTIFLKEQPSGPLADKARAEYKELHDKNYPH
jgi:Tfp pilus assembly protein PilF